MAKTIPADEKVFMVSKTTNTTYSGSAALKAMNEWYTMDDVTNTVRPYKVYTALLTQSGGGAESSVEDGFITIGISYQITDQGGSGWDFTNVGAPNNNVGTYFIATGTTPASWGNGVSLSYNTGAPVVTVLENTIGNIWFTYEASGVYNVNSNLLFTDNKTILLSAYFTGTNGDVTYNTIFNQVDTSTIGITIPDGNGWLNGSPIEIRVYS